MHDFSQFSRIRMLWPDHLGLARGKYVPPSLAHHGSGFCVTTFAMAHDRDLIPAPGAAMLEGLKDVHGTIDPTTLRPSWEDDRTGVCVADLALDGEPYEVSARVALQRALDAWEALGYTVKAGIELEGYLLEQRPDGTWDRASNPRSMVYGTGPLGEPTGFFDEVLRAADGCGFVIESANVEFDESQFEFTLRYDDAMKAADNAFLFRTLVREVAVMRGQDFTFLGKPFPAVSGSGLHVNFSVLDADGHPAFADGDDPDGISDLLRQGVAGLIEHHQALTAILAPTVNAYRRLQPGSLAGCWANWGIDHRNVTSRIPATSDPAAMRIEHRMADGAVNIHTAVAALLRAALLGVEGAYELGPEYTADGFEDGGDGVARSADSLDEALDHLEADTALRAALGELLVDNFVANKRHEAERFAASGGDLDGDELTAFETDQYLPYH